MSKKVLCIAAGLVLAGASGAVAQDGRHKGDGPGGGGGGGGHGGGHAAPAARAAPQAPRAAPQMNRGAPQHSFAPRSEPRRQMAAPERQQRDAGRAYRANEPSGRAERGVERRATEQRRASQQETNQRRERAEQQRGAERQRAAERQQQQRGADRQRAAEREQLKDQRGYNPSRSADRPNQSERRSADRDGKPSERYQKVREARTQLSVDQRRRLRSAFNFDRRHKSNVRFAARVGGHVPRHVRLFAIPAAAYGLFSYYRGYEYVVLDDTICIVDPATYEIVDVIDQGPDARPEIAQLSLSGHERTVVLSSIPPDFPQDRVRLRLALGAEIPVDVELHEFAPIVINEVPRLGDFRFLITDEQVVIVDPRDRAIALVLER